MLPAQQPAYGGYGQQQQGYAGYYQVECPLPALAKLMTCCAASMLLAS